MGRFQVDVPPPSKKEGEQPKAEIEHALPTIIKDLESSDPQVQKLAAESLVLGYKSGDKVYAENAKDVIDAITAYENPTAEQRESFKKILNDLEGIAAKQRKEAISAVDKAEGEKPESIEKVELLKSRFEILQNIDINNAEKVRKLDAGDLAVYMNELKALANDSANFENPEFESQLWSELAYIDRLTGVYASVMHKEMRQPGADASEIIGDLKLNDQAMAGIQEVKELIKKEGRKAEEAA